MNVYLSFINKILANENLVNNYNFSYPDKKFFLKTMRNYMPEAHKDFIETLQNSPSIRKFGK